MTTNLTGNIQIDSLYNGGLRLNDSSAVGTPVVVTYAFASASSFSDSTNFKDFNDAQKQSLRASLQLIHNVCGVQFVEVTDATQADIKYSIDTAYVSRWGPGSAGITVPKWYSNGFLVIPEATWIDFNTAAYNTVTSTTISPLVGLHETLHALGLKHPGPYDNTAGPYLPTGLDTHSNTVMSYNGPNVQQLGPFDIQTLQYLYGKSIPDGTPAVFHPTAAAASSGVVYGTGMPDIVDLLAQEWGYARSKNIFFGSSATNTFNMTAPAETIDLGAGTDTLKIPTLSNAAKITRNSDGSLHVVADFKMDPTAIHAAIAGGGDPSTFNWMFHVDSIVENVERTQFDDVTMAWETSGTAAQAYRLYQAAFNRKPDAPGVGWQIKALDNGMSLLQVAQNFVGSAEFKSLYGANPTDTQLVNLLYQNVLHRTPQQFETNFWVGVLAGTNPNSHQTPAEVLMSFSESAENQTNVIGVLQNGFQYTTYT